MSDNFLPNNYDVPSSSNGYMRFQEGENKFRILTSPIIGWETWMTTKDGSRKPLRTPMDKPFRTDEVEDLDSIRHFWAMVVYNYQEERIQILEITQKSLQKSIKALARDEDWGSPLNYDLVVTREGKEMDTRYNLNPKPAKKLPTEIQKQFEEMQINLNALYKGEDPFARVETSETVSEDAIEAGI